MIRLRIPAARDRRDLALRLVAAACRFVGFDDCGSRSRQASEQFERDVVATFAWALDRVADDSDAAIEIEIEPNRDGITIRLRHQHDRARAPGSGAGWNLGQLIIRSPVDDVTYCQIEGWNVLTLTKRLR